MNAQKAAWIAVGAIAVVGLVAMLNRRNARPDAASPSAALEEPAQSSLPPAVGHGVDAASSSASVSIASAREASDNDRAFGYALDADGQALAGVEVSWLPLAEEFVPTMRGWDAIDWNAVELGTLRALSDESGRFEFDSVPPTGALGSALWLTAEDFGVELRVLAPGAWLADGGIIRMHRRPRLAVRVVDAAGSALVSARVTHRGVRPGPSEPVDRRIELAYRLFHAESLTDQDGQSFFPALRGRQGLFAQSDDGEAVPWFGEVPEDAPVLLSILPTFVLVGSVRLEEGGRLPEDVFIECLMSSGAVKSLHVEQTTVRADGSFGPMQLPIGSNDTTYSVGLSGGNLQPCSVTVSKLEAGETRTVELVGQYGVELPVRVTSPGQSGVESATVRAVWWTTASAGVNAEAVTNSSGFALLTGVRPGEAWVKAEARGFVPVTVGPLEIHADNPEPIDIVLERGGVLRGRVVHREQPVAHFGIAWWSPPTLAPQFVRFTNASDGAFELNNVPLGRIEFIAHADELGQSSVTAADVSLEAGQAVLVQLTDAHTIRGRVVDSRTLEPVSGAIVRRWLQSNDHILAPAGARAEVATDGSFELSGFPIGMARFTVEADGYPQRLVTTQVEAGIARDVGTVPLERGQSISFELVTEKVVDPRDFALEFVGPHNVPMQHFDADGRAVIEHVAPGEWSFVLVGPSKVHQQMSATLRSGEPWQFRFRLRGDRSVRVRVAGFRTLPFESSFEVSIQPTERDRASLWLSQPVVADGDVDFDNVPAVECIVELIDGTGTCFAVESLSAEQNAVELKLEREGLRIVVVDESGAPIADAVVVVRSADRDDWQCTARTNVSGRCSIPPLPFRRCTALPSRADLGFGRPVALPDPGEGTSPDDELVLVLDASAAIEVVVHDDGEALAGLNLELRSAHHAHLLQSASSGGQGAARFAGIALGAYDLSVAGVGVWSDVFRVEAEKEPHAARLRVFRTASIEIASTGSDGAPRPGVSVALEHLELDSTVSEWMHAGRLAPRTLSTDAQGNLRVDGIPNGRYRWTCTSPSGSASGLVSVEPGEIRRVLAQLP